MSDSTDGARELPSATWKGNMNKSILNLSAAFFLCAVPLRAPAQGTVAFANNTTTRITNSATGEPIYGTNDYRIGLYVGPAGSTADQLTLVGIATNAPSFSPSFVLAGLFNGGNPFFLPNGYPQGVQIAFQIRFWTLADGDSYEEALLSKDPDLLLGVSQIGSATPGGGPIPPGGLPLLFGTGPGQVAPLVVAPIPEPSVLPLAGLGVAGWLLFTGKRRPTESGRP